MDDEVSVAELLEREGWTEAEQRAKGKLRVMAVMLAVIVGCGLAALLVHFGSQDPQADAPSLLDLPHGPTGGLAGGGVPSNPPPTEQTGGDSSVVVTNQVGPVLAGVPWSTTRSSSSTETDTSAGPSVTPTSGSKPETTTPTNTGPPGGNDSSTPGNTPTATRPSNCWLIINWC